MSDVGGIGLSWWRSQLQADSGSARALRARLRRADSLVEVLGERAVHDLAGDLAGADAALKWSLRGEGAVRLAALVQVLAAVEDHVPSPLARRFGEGDRPALSELRFQRLMRLQDPEDLGLALRRALPLAGKACNVARLAEDILNWAEATRVRWCFEYFGAAPPTTIRSEAWTSGAAHEEADA